MPHGHPKKHDKKQTQSQEASGDFGVYSRQPTLEESPQVFAETDSEDSHVVNEAYKKVREGRQSRLEARNSAEEADRTAAIAKATAMNAKFAAVAKETEEAGSRRVRTAPKAFNPDAPLTGQAAASKAVACKITAGAAASSKKTQKMPELVAAPKTNNKKCKQRRGAGGKAQNPFDLTLDSTSEEDVAAVAARKAAAAADGEDDMVFTRTGDIYVKKEKNESVPQIVDTFAPGAAGGGAAADERRSPENEKYPEWAPSQLPQNFKVLAENDFRLPVGEPLQHLPTTLPNTVAMQHDPISLFKKHLLKIIHSSTDEGALGLDPGQPFDVADINRQFRSSIRFMHTDKFRDLGDEVSDLMLRATQRMNAAKQNLTELKGGVQPGDLEALEAVLATDNNASKKVSALSRLRTRYGGVGAEAAAVVALGLMDAARRDALAVGGAAALEAFDKAPDISDFSDKEGAGAAESFTAAYVDEEETIDEAIAPEGEKAPAAVADEMEEVDEGADEMEEVDEGADFGVVGGRDLQGEMEDAEAAAYAADDDDEDGGADEVEPDRVNNGAAAGVNDGAAAGLDARFRKPPRLEYKPKKKRKTGFHNPGPRVYVLSGPQKKAKLKRLLMETHAFKAAQGAVDANVKWNLLTEQQKDDQDKKWTDELELMLEQLNDIKTHMQRFNPMRRRYFEKKKEWQAKYDRKDYLADAHIFMMNWCFHGTQGLCKVHKWALDFYDSKPCLKGYWHNVLNTKFASPEEDFYDSEE